VVVVRVGVEMLGVVLLGTVVEELRHDWWWLLLLWWWWCWMG
jgi:hypothetical protein